MCACAHMAQQIRAWPVTGSGYVCQCAPIPGTCTTSPRSIAFKVDFADNKADIRWGDGPWPCEKELFTQWGEQNWSDRLLSYLQEKLTAH